MKKFVRTFALLLVVVLLLSTTPMAFAATSKFEVAGAVSGLTTSTDDLGVTTLTYANSAIVKDGQYAIFVVKGSADDYTITENSLLYIGQEAATEAGTVTFEKVYPSSIANSVILISGKDLSLSVVAEIKANYTLGDVNNDEKITTRDAMLVAQWTIGMPISTAFNEDAADVNGDDEITTRDAMMIAQFTIGSITKFPAE